MEEEAGDMATEYTYSAGSSGQRDSDKIDHPYRQHPKSGVELYEFVEWQRWQAAQAAQHELWRQQEKDDKDRLERANEAEFHDTEKEDEAIENDGGETATVRPMRLL